MFLFRWLDCWIGPDLRVDSIWQVTPARLCERGIRALLLDLDGTLKGHYETELAPEVPAWIEQFSRAGIRVAVVSNCTPELLVPFARTLAGVPCFCRARKPLPFVCRRVLDELGVPRIQAAILGDQFFTDVLAGHWAGLFTIMVPPLSPIEPWHIRIRRPPGTSAMA